MRNLHLTFDWHYIGVRWRFRKILWPSQNIWILFWHSIYLPIYSIESLSTNSSAVTIHIKHLKKKLHEKSIISAIFMVILSRSSTNHVLSVWRVQCTYSQFHKQTHACILTIVHIHSKKMTKGGMEKPQVTQQLRCCRQLNKKTPLDIQAKNKTWFNWVQVTFFNYFILWNIFFFHIHHI